MDKEEITINEIIEALRQAESPAEDGGLSSWEIACHMGRPQTWVRERLRKLVANGTIGVHRAYRPRVDGVRIVVPVYYLKQ